MEYFFRLYRVFKIKYPASNLETRNNSASNNHLYKLRNTTLSNECP